MIIPVSMVWTDIQRVSLFHRKGAKNAKTNIFNLPQRRGDAEFYNQVYRNHTSSRPKSVTAIHCKQATHNNHLCASAPLRLIKVTLRTLRLCGASLPRSRMCLVVNTGQVLEVEVGIYLRRAKVGMSQQLLHRAQIIGRFEDM